MLSRADMEPLIRHLTTVLGEGVVLTDTPIPGLPLAIQNLYRTASATVLGQRCTFLVHRGSDAITADATAKHMAVIRDKQAQPGHLVVVTERMTPALRRTLVAARVPFVVPGAHLFLPFLGLLFAERFPAPKPAVEVLRPAAQATVLWWIHHGLTGADTARLLAPHLGYTPMSLSRVFDDLERLAGQTTAMTIEHVGRERKARWAGGGRDLWLAMRPYMRNPVVRREVVVAKADMPMLPAGLSGLAQLSDLTAPDHPIVAIERAAWATYLSQERPQSIEPGEPDAVIVEVWRYAPDLHTGIDLTPVVTADPLSIAIAVANQPLAADERVEAALEYLITEFPWRW